MAFSVSSLPDYVEQHKGELLTQAALGAPTISHINIQTGVKYQSALNLLSSSVALQTRSCGFNSNGTVTYTQRTLTVGAYKVNISLCEEDLRQKWQNVELIARAGGEVLPYEEKTAQVITDNIKKQVESLIWTAKKASDQFDGLLTIAKADATAVTSSATTNWGLIQDVYRALPAEVASNAAIFIGTDMYRDFILELVAANLYHYNPGEAADELSIYLPGSKARVIGVPGLDDTGAIVAGDPENFVFGCDMANDEEVYDLFYSKDNQEFRFVAKFNAGTQIAFPSEVRYYAPASDSSAS